MRSHTLVLLLWVLYSACGAGRIDVTQESLTRVAQMVLVVPEDARTHYYERLDADCRERLPPSDHTLAEWQECMAPAYRLDRSVGTLDAMLRAAQATLDASGEDGVRAMLPDLVRAARDVSRALTEAGLPIPDDVGRILLIGEALSPGEDQ